MKIQREFLVQGEFLVIPLFLLSKGESFLMSALANLCWRIFVADGEFLLLMANLNFVLLMANLVDLLHGVPNMSKVAG